MTHHLLDLPEVEVNIICRIFDLSLREYSIIAHECARSGESFLPVLEGYRNYQMSEALCLPVSPRQRSKTHKSIKFLHRQIMRLFTWLRSLKYVKSILLLSLS